MRGRPAFVGRFKNHLAENPTRGPWHILAKRPPRYGVSSHSGTTIGATDQIDSGAGDGRDDQVITSSDPFGRLPQSRLRLGWRAAAAVVGMRRPDLGRLGVLSFRKPTDMTAQNKSYPIHKKVTNAQKISQPATRL